MSKRITGFNSKTMEHRLTGAGAYYKNYDPKTDTPSTATAKLIGATKGGGSFMAKANIRAIEVDGIPGKVKGMEEIDSWDVEMSANILEIKPETIQMALAFANITTETSPQNYKKIAGKNLIEEADYLDNITFIGKVSGYEKPIIIQIFNAFSTDGLNAQTKDKDELVLSVKWIGHYSFEELDNPPFAIWYPTED